MIGKVGDVPVAVMQGRVHFYEGYSIKEVVFPMRVLRQLGIQAFRRGLSTPASLAKARAQGHRRTLFRLVASGLRLQAN